jgi:hypothetical protein
MNSGQQSRLLQPGRRNGRFNGTLASAIVMAAVGVLCLLLFGLAVPGTGHAATSLPAARALAPQIAYPFAQTMTTTVFLPVVYRSPDATSNRWQGEYYANANLAGNPVYTTQEKRVDYDWGKSGSPTGLPHDYFSIRWTGDWDFEYGVYTFFVYADDGLRLWLDDDLLVDAWQPGQGWHQATRTITTAGAHHLRLEYFEQTGGASVRLGWRRTDLYPQWEGSYYNNAWVENTRVYGQTDSTIEFDWEEGCPDNLADCDNFSISWTARPVFETGTYRFYIYADEGYQLLVDGSKKAEGGWFDGQGGGGEDTYYDLVVISLQYHDIRFNFHDRGGPAEARLWIQKRGYPDWTAEYYGNKTLSGTPVKIKDEEAVFYDWGPGKPVNALPGNDSFSARWTGSRYFHAGCYSFGVFADDGVRLWVDGELLVDQWHDGRGDYHSLYTYLTTGYHDVKIEYYENTGDAEIRFWWE